MRRALHGKEAAAGEAAPRRGALAPGGVDWPWFFAIHESVVKTEFTDGSSTREQ
jgi:hypothetical protein